MTPFYFWEPDSESSSALSKVITVKSQNSNPHLVFRQSLCSFSW